jgi:hypothetical protein
MILSKPKLPPEASLRATIDISDSLRAIGTGAVVIVAGSLAMTTCIGVVATIGMVLRGETGEIIISRLCSSLEVALWCAAGGWLMSLVGGYMSAARAGHAYVAHAVWTGVLAIPLSLAVVALLGDSGPAWLCGLSIMMIVPCAALGGWMASPINQIPAAKELRQ